MTATGTLILALGALLLPLSSGLQSVQGDRAVHHAVQRPARGEVVEDFGAFVAPCAAERSESIRFERVTTAVPWPRGLEFVDGQLVVLARGRHRNAGGIDPTVEDRAGCLFAVDPEVSEPVVHDRAAGARVRANARLLADSEGLPFLHYDPESGPPVEDVHMDRPYCTLVYDALSENFFICGYSGVDLPGRGFRKNATDSIHRYDLRNGRWHAVELHHASVVPEDELGYTVPNDYYPHHDPSTHQAPHGWLNGGDGAAVAGSYLYVVAKDNHLLAQYDLDQVRRDSEAGAPESRAVLGSRIDLLVAGELLECEVLGHSAAAVYEDHLYVGFRTSSVVVRFALEADGDLVQPPVGELVAVFEPYDAQRGTTADLMDIAFNGAGELFVSCAEQGRIWKVGVPDPERVFNGIESGPHATTNRPFVDLRVLTDHSRARTGNIAFDDEDRLYLCSGNYDSGSRLAGVIYRVSGRASEEASATSSAAVRGDYPAPE